MLYEVCFEAWFANNIYRFYLSKKHVKLGNDLIDTGCAVSITDPDAVELTGLKIDPINGVVKRMYGIGGKSELCYEQRLSELKIGDIFFFTFVLQLGMIRGPYFGIIKEKGDLYERNQTERNQRKM